MGRREEAGVFMEPCKQCNLVHAAINKRPGLSKVRDVA